ncbi:hypothetical protein [Sphingopyxis sp.]|uniref:hypothetical protein n=1 Tax=Sphingopyxis sp. TaxID=1908224 RepID=UPI002ED990F6
MTIPNDLIDKCERNQYCWHRETPSDIDVAFEKLGLPKTGELYIFARKYCLQFASESIPFQLVDIVEDDGTISDNIYYAREELKIEPTLVPISTYEAESILVVDVNDERVLQLTPNDAGDAWISEIISPSLYSFMLSHLP